MKRVSQTQLARILDAQRKGGRLFSVVFIKRTTGETRRMVCRFGVTSYLKGGSPAYDFAAYNLVCVFDVQALEYRCINLDGLLEAKVGGVHYRVR